MMVLGRRGVIAAMTGFVVCLIAAPHARAQETPRTTIAVSPVQIDAAVRPPANFSANALTREIEAAIDATRRFDVVSRGVGAATAVLEEQVATGGGNVSAQRAQLLVAVEVLGLELRQETSPVPNLAGKSATRTIGRIQMQIQILSQAGRTREVRSRFPIDARVSTTPVVHDTGRPLDSGAASIGFNELAHEAGIRIADRLRDEIYPVQVVTRQGAEVILNRGEDSGYRRGERLRVFAAGEALIDPETGENLGAMETELGVVEVTDLLPRVTRTRIVQGGDAIARGNIVRR